MLSRAYTNWQTIHKKKWEIENYKIEHATYQIWVFLLFVNLHMLKKLKKFVLKLVYLIFNMYLFNK